MRLNTANGVFVFVPHVVGFSSWPSVLDPSSHRCSRASPLVCQQHLIRKVPPRTNFLSAASEVWSCSRKRLPRGSKSRKRAYGMTSLSTTTTSTLSPTASLTTPAETPRASLSVSIIGTNAAGAGLLIAERFSYPVKSMCELMEGRKGRKTDLVRVKAVLQWLEGEASGDARRHVSGLAMPVRWINAPRREGFETLQRCHQLSKMALFLQSEVLLARQ